MNARTALLSGCSIMALGRAIGERAKRVVASSPNGKWSVTSEQGGVEASITDDGVMTIERWDGVPRSRGARRVHRG